MGQLQNKMIAYKLQSDDVFVMDLLLGCELFVLYIG